MKPTQEQMQDESKWIRCADRQPENHGFYAVRSNDKFYGPKEFWLIYDGDGQWTHGHYVRELIAEERALYNQRTGQYIHKDQWPDMAWFQKEPDLFA